MQDGTTQEVTTDPTQTPRMRGTGLRVRLGESTSRKLDSYVAQGLLTVRQAEGAVVKDGEFFVQDERRHVDLEMPEEVPASLQAAMVAEDAGGVRGGLEESLIIYSGIAALQSLAGRNAKKSGWHADRPQRQAGEGPNVFAARLRNWQGMKIMLMVSELAEGVEELRKGKEAAHTYYPGVEMDPKGTDWSKIKGKVKPEGLPSELADTVIRIMDFCYTEGINLADMILEKLSFNQTRGQKHGGKTV